MLIYHALAIRVIVKTLSGEMHIQVRHTCRGIPQQLQQYRPKPKTAAARPPFQTGVYDCYIYLKYIIFE